MAARVSPSRSDPRRDRVAEGAPGLAAVPGVASLDAPGIRDDGAAHSVGRGRRATWIAANRPSSICSLRAHAPRGATPIAAWPPSANPCTSSRRRIIRRRCGSTTSGRTSRGSRCCPRKRWSGCSTRRLTCTPTGSTPGSPRWRPVGSTRCERRRRAVSTSAASGGWKGSSLPSRSRRPTCRPAMKARSA